MRTRCFPVPEASRLPLTRILFRYAGVFAAAFLLLAFAGGCQSTEKGYYQGYAEAEFTYIASPLGGRLMARAVERGEQVAAGQKLFSLEDVLETQAVKESRGRVNQAEARLADMHKGMRPSEIKGIEAMLAQARAVLDLSRLEYKRHEKLYKDKAIAKSQMDKVRTKFQTDEDRVEELSAMLETARLGARADQILAAGDEVKAYKARLSQAEWNQEQKTQNAPHAGRVLDTFYTEGEWVAPGRPVLALLVPENLKVRFFVPEPEFSGWEYGQEVSLGCDGCPPGLTAQISYISPQAEYTPPVIYSRETRSKLVFMLEAKPEPGSASALHPGQPMEVRRMSRGGL